MLCIMIVQKTVLGIQAQASTDRGTPCGSVDMIPGDIGSSG